MPCNLDRLVTRAEDRAALGLGPLVAGTCPSTAPTLVKARKPAAKHPMANPRLSEATSDEDALNKTERAFLAWLRAKPGQYRNIGIQNIRLGLAYRCTYRPDFTAMTPDRGFVLFEVKGPYVREDSWVKLKTAARLYPWWVFIKAQKQADGHWTVVEIPR